MKRYALIGLSALLMMANLAATLGAEVRSYPVPTGSETTLGGYVDTSAEWNPGSGNANQPHYKFGGTGKADGFNLNVIELRLDKPLPDGGWSAGYRVDLWAGPDASALGTRSPLSAGTNDFAIRQAYLALGVPVGNGFQCKFGVFDSPIGFESLESPVNANVTASYGRSIEPQTLTGVLVRYRFNEILEASVGVANTVNSAINSRAQQGSAGGYIGGAYGDIPAGQNAYAESYKAYLGAVTLSAPKELGWFSGSALSLGAINGYNNSGGTTKAFINPEFGDAVGLPDLNTYVGLVLNTPIKGVRFGAAFDWLNFDSWVSDENFGFFTTFPVEGGVKALAGYASYQATDKLSLHARYEYVDADLDSHTGYMNKTRLTATTLTAQYDLWRNVLSRIELRWDHSLTGDLFGGEVTGRPARTDAWLLVANVVYRF